MKVPNTKVLIAGCGDLGTKLAELLLQADFNVTGLRRSAQRDRRKFPLIIADVTRPDSLEGLSALNPSIVVYCVSADAQSDESYRLNYVEGLSNVLSALSASTDLKHVFFVSSTRVYGQLSESLLDESDEPQPKDFGGMRLLEAEALLKEVALHAKTQFHATALRLSGIYGPGRSRMIDLAKSINTWPVNNDWTNRIHRDDAAAFMMFLINKSLAEEMVDDCYVVTDSCPVPQYEVLNWIATRMGCPNLQHSEVEGGKRLSNRRMLATNFKLRYPDYRVGYATLLE